LHRRPHALRDGGRDALAGLHRAVPVHADEVALEAEEAVGDGGEVRRVSLNRVTRSISLK
jgi:hypothetical protein